MSRQAIWQIAGNKNLHDKEAHYQRVLMVRKMGYRTKWNAISSRPAGTMMDSFASAVKMQNLLR
jgi:hypothetical protein